MTYRGQVLSGVIVLDGGVQLPEGLVVVVQPAETPQAEESFADQMEELAVNTGIPDLSRNIDHYLYGHPKVSNGDK